MGWGRLAGLLPPVLPAEAGGPILRVELWRSPRSKASFCEFCSAPLLMRRGLFSWTRVDASYRIWCPTRGTMQCHAFLLYRCAGYDIANLRLTSCSLLAPRCADRVSQHVWSVFVLNSSSRIIGGLL